MKLSVIIPSYKDPFLHKTIDSLLDNSGLGDDLEIIVVLDAYWPKDIIRNDKRIKIVHHGINTGMRGAINDGVRVASGEYIMRVDEHNMFDRGYDVKLLANIEDNWIVTPRRYFLDPVKWERMDFPPVDFQRLIVAGAGSRKKFAGVSWKQRDEEWKDIMVGETMAMQGSCWIMKKSWWDKVIVELQSEGYGTHYQDSVEMVFKTWQAGGKLILNKNTWHAHKHRSFKRTHSYPGDLADASFKYALDTWGEYYYNVIRPRFSI